MLVEDAIKIYLENLHAAVEVEARRPRTFDSVSRVLWDLRSDLQGTAVETITETTLRDHINRLSTFRKWSPCTKAYRYTIVKSFLKAQGVVVTNRFRTKFSPPDPTIYSDAELERFFGACRDDLFTFVLFKTFLWTGCRKQELKFAEWSDITADGFLVIRNKPGYDFKTKSNKNRRVPLIAPLRALLQQWKGHRPGTLLFPTKNGLPNNHFDRIIKQIAVKAGLDPSQWHLHKFRRTYATLALQRGVDLKSVQKALGHNNLESTMCYLQGLDGDALLRKMESVFTQGALHQAARG
jgi:integrase